MRQIIEGLAQPLFLQLSQLSGFSQMSHKATQIVEQLLISFGNWPSDITHAGGWLTDGKDLWTLLDKHVGWNDGVNDIVEPTICQVGICFWIGLVLNNFSQ